MQTGLLGAFTFGWIIVRAFRMLARIAKTDSGQDGWLATALAAGILGFAVGMFTFDAFSFIQVTCLFFVYLALTGLLHATALEARAPGNEPRLVPERGRG